MEKATAQHEMPRDLLLLRLGKSQEQIIDLFSELSTPYPLEQ
jgi:hypothetical protein